MTDTVREVGLGPTPTKTTPTKAPKPSEAPGTLKAPKSASSQRRDEAKVAENSGFLSIAAGIVGVLSYACTLLMANLLPTVEYTQFAACAMLLGVVGIVASAMVPLPLSHFVTAHPAGSEERRDGIAFSVFVSLLAGLAAALITGVLALGFATPALAAAVAVAALVIFMVAAPSGWLQGELRFKWYAFTTVGEVGLRLAFSMLAIAVAWNAAGAVAGFGVGAVALVAVPWSFYKDLTWRPRVLREKWRWEETADIASVLCVVSVLVGTDVVAVAFLAQGSPDAAGFQALATIAKGPVYVAAGTALVAFPLLRRPGVNVREVLGSAFASFGQLALVAFAVIATAPAALAGLIIPGKYHGSLGLLPWLAAAGLGYAVLTVLATILLALRAYRRCQLGLALACVLVIGSLWAGWHLGAVAGMAVGSAVGAVVAAAVLGTIAFPVLKPETPWTAFARPAAAGTALILTLALASWLQPVVWLAVAGISGVAVLAHQRGMLTLKRPETARRRITPPGKVREGSPFGRHSKPSPSSLGLPGNAISSALLHPFAALVAVVLAAFGVRAFGLARAFELWVDELLYVQLGQSVSQGQFPTLPDGPFFLHPPGFFVLEAGIIKLFGIEGDIVDVVLQLRWLNAALGAVTVGLGFLLIRRLAGARAAWLAATMLAFEPFILRNNSHAFLETSAMAAVLAGLLLLVGPAEKTAEYTAQGSIMGAPPTSAETRTMRRRTAQLIGAGIFLGYAVLCKDFFIICTAGPVVLAVVWKKTLSWRQAAVVVSTAAIPYIAYLAVATVQGHAPDWVAAKASGLLRASGIEKSTGFTAEGSPSLLARLVDQSSHFGTSYVLLALCPVVGLVLCFSLHAKRRLLGLTGLTLGCAGAYSAVFGTFEEQYGYGVMIAGVLCSVVAVVEMRERFRRGRKLLTVIGVCFVALTVVLGVRTVTTVDNGFVQVRDWVKTNLPADAKVGVTNSTAEFAFAADQRFGVWPSAPLMQGAGADYILTQSHPTSQGYGYATRDMLEWLESNATSLVRVEGPTNGFTTLWHVAPEVLDQAAMSGTGIPSKNYETER